MGNFLWTSQFHNGTCQTAVTFLSIRLDLLGKCQNPHFLTVDDR